MAEQSSVLFGALGAILGYLGVGAADSVLFECLLWPERFYNDFRNGAMICSFIAQLGKLWSFDTTKLQNSVSNPLSHIDVKTIAKDGNLPKLCELFGHLVQRLPEQATLICIVDGISHYETDEFEEGLLEVLGYLLSLARNRDMGVTVKVLANSPITTDLVQTQFRDDDSSFISLAEIRDLGPGAWVNAIGDVL